MSLGSFKLLGSPFLNGHGGVDKKDAEGKLSLAFRHPFYPYQRDMQLGDASGRDGPESNTFLVMMTGNHPRVRHGFPFLFAIISYASLKFSPAEGRDSNHPV